MSTPPILLVEGNPVDVDLTIRAFRRSRVANPITVAGDGEEALAGIGRWSAGERLPLVVLLSLNLPQVSGLEVLRAFKAHPSCRAVPVIVLTDSNCDDQVRQAYDCGASSYLVKPVDFAKFAEVAAQIEIYWTMQDHVSQS